MRSAALVPACLMLIAGCAEPGLPPPCSPGALPQIGQHQLVPPKEGKGDDATKVAKAEGDEDEPKPEASTSAESASGEDASAPGAETEGEREAKAEDEPTSAKGQEASGTEAAADANPAEGEATPEDAKEAAAGEPAEGTPAEGEPAEGTAAEAEPAEGTPAEGEGAAAQDEPDEETTTDEEPVEETPEAKLARFEAARDDVERSIDWLICVVPYKLPDAQIDAWVERRNLVLDWIENHPTLGYTFSAPIMAPIHKDRRNTASMYMNFAYAVGKARYLLANPTPDPIEAEVAALEMVAKYYVAFKEVEPKLEARKFARLLRKKKRGKLRKWIIKKLASG